MTKPIANAFGPLTGPAELLIKSQPVLFSLIILYQGLFSGNAVVIPERLKTLFDNNIFRFVSLMLIAFSATQDFEYALLSTLIFVTVLYALKTPEERKKTGLV